MRFVALVVLDGKGSGLYRFIFALSRLERAIEDKHPLLCRRIVDRPLTGNQRRTPRRPKCPRQPHQSFAALRASSPCLTSGQHGQFCGKRAIPLLRQPHDLAGGEQTIVEIHSR